MECPHAEEVDLGGLAGVAQSPFEKGIVVDLKGAEQGHRPGSGVHSRSKPIQWVPKVRAPVRKSVVQRLSKRAVRQRSAGRPVHGTVTHPPAARTRVKHAQA